MITTRLTDLGLLLFFLFVPLGMFSLILLAPALGLQPGSYVPIRQEWEKHGYVPLSPAAFHTF